jgi:CBS domain-containing protein
MSPTIIFVAPDDSAIDAFKVMGKRNIGRVLVMEKERLVGIVSRTDLVRVLQMRES